LRIINFQGENNNKNRSNYLIHSYLSEKNKIPRDGHNKKGVAPFGTTPVSLRSILN